MGIKEKLQANITSGEQATAVIQAQGILDVVYRDGVRARDELDALTQGTSFDTVDLEIKQVGLRGINLLKKFIEDIEADADLLAFVNFRKEA